MAQEKHLGSLTDLQVIDQLLNVKDQFLIDAGCGNMHLSKALAERGAHILAIDPDPVQAQKNNAADTITNVGFVETGADQIPCESGSVDGVIFPYSLHHIPTALHAKVFNEVQRVLTNTGFLYVIEPVAEGDLNEVMRLFHDEKQVRAEAQHSLDTLAIPGFKEAAIYTYTIPLKYDSWEQYSTRYAKKSYNTNYTKEQVMAEPVRQRFIELAEKNGFAFESPMRVTFLQSPIKSALA